MARRGRRSPSSAAAVAGRLRQGRSAGCRWRRAGRRRRRQPPPPEVGVVVATPGDVGLVTELPGRLEASRVAQVRARAAGILQKRLFREGSDVKAGQPLFQHRLRALRRPRCTAPQAALARAAGQRWRRPRRWPSATSRWSRPTPSASRTTPTPWPRRSRPRPTSPPAGRGADRADQPRLCLGHGADLRPHRPRAGHRRRAGRARAKRRQLARDPADQPDLRQLHAVGHRGAAAAPRAGRTASSSAPTAPTPRRCASCWKTAANIAQPGKLLFTDLTVDPTSGQVTLRAEVPNPDGAAAARPVRARAPRAGAGQQRHRCCRSRR